MNIGDYYTNGQRVVHLYAFQGREWWRVLIWADATATSTSHWLRSPEGRAMIEGHRKLTPAEVRQWVAGGPVPGREET